MYASEVDGRKLTFYVSGKLWGRSLVMGDKETGSDWSHILGKSMAGKMKDKTLTILPATMTTWQDWLAQHPNTTVTMLKPTAREFRQEMLEYADEYCMALVHDGKSRYWQFDLLEKNNVVNDELSDLTLVVYYDAKHSSANVWNRHVNDTTLTFRQTPQGLIDNETSSIWDLRKGLAVDGKLKGIRLDATVAIVSFSEAWRRFHPDTSKWSP